jgi:hypothetical protein
MKDEEARMKDLSLVRRGLQRSGFSLILDPFAFILVFLTLSLLAPIAGQAQVKSRRATKASICGNPLVACKTSAEFQPFDLPFRVPRNSVIFDTEMFYAVILKSITVTDDYNCNAFVPETERLAAQALFPDHKVFTSRCTEPGNLFYTTISENHRFMAVYAGTTPAESKRMLAAVKATGKFSGAYLKRMRTGFNGT